MRRSHSYWFGEVRPKFLGQWRISGGRRRTYRGEKRPSLPKILQRADVQRMPVLVRKLHHPVNEEHHILHDTVRFQSSFRVELNRLTMISRRQPLLEAILSKKKSFCSRTAARTKTQCCSSGRWIGINHIGFSQYEVDLVFPHTAASVALKRIRWRSYVLSTAHCVATREEGKSDREQKLCNAAATPLMIQPLRRSRCVVRRSRSSISMVVVGRSSRPTTKRRSRSL